MRYYGGALPQQPVSATRRCRSQGSPTSQKGASLKVRTSASDRAESGRHEQLSWQLQSMRYSLPGTAVLQALQTTACQEHWEVAIMPALPGLGSLSGQRAAPVAAHPGSAVGPVHSSPRGSAGLNTSSKVLNTARYSIREGLGPVEFTFARDLGTRRNFI